MCAMESSRSSDNGQFALCIEGLPASYTWQDVKDLLRNCAEHGIRADVAFRVGLSGEKIPVHVAKLTRWTEANNSYDWLISRRIEGRQLRVHFFEGPTCMKSNCQLPGSQCSVCKTRQGTDQRSAATYQTSYSPAASWNGQAPSGSSRSSLAPPLTTPASSREYSTQAGSSGYGTTPTTAHYAAPAVQRPSATSTAAQQTEYALKMLAATGQVLNSSQAEFLRRMAAMRLDSAPSQPSASVSTPPVLAAAASGAPINTAYGYARTEVRGVFVAGLDFKTRTQDLVDLFSKVGTVKKCQLHTDSRGHGKGTATIEFSASDEAAQAIKALNNFPWRGRTLRVRSDREAIVVRAPGSMPESSRSSAQPTSADEAQEPIIVDGSNSRQIRRDSKITFK